MEISLTALLRNVKHLDLNLKYAWRRMHGQYPRPQVVDEALTVETLLKTKASVARFGDGEFRWMLGIKNDAYQTFQKDDPVLGTRLRQVFNSQSANCLICIPGNLAGKKGYTAQNVLAWKHLIVDHGSSWWPLLDTKRQYYDANFTRPYIDRLDKPMAKSRFTHLKQLWQDQRILVVEGESTYFGVGNDLLNGATKVSRIICPSTDAFKNYQQILDQILMVSSEYDVALLALGPTATVLAYDLSQMTQLQALDIGHVDLEYEWYLTGAKKREHVAHRYVAELDESDDGVLHDEKYDQEIIAKIIG